MAGKAKKPEGAVGKGGISPAPRAEDMTVRAAAEQLLMVPIGELVPYAGNARNLKEETAEMPAYVYPPEVVTPGLLWSPARRGQGLYIRAEDAAFVRALDSQKAVGKSIFGGGFLLSGKAAAEKAAAEKAAAEKAAAEKAAAVKWQLSLRELEIVRNLGRRGEYAGTETANGLDHSQGEKAPEQNGGGGAAES